MDQTTVLTLKKKQRQQQERAIGLLTLFRWAKFRLKQSLVVGLSAVPRADNSNLPSHEIESRPIVPLITSNFVVILRIHAYSAQYICVYS
jgi:hypothetical protein